MTSLFKGTRGISPLVATVLLIAFSVALGAVVMSWGESYIEQRAEFVSGRSEVGGPCDTALVTIIKVKDQIQICERDNTLELFVESGPQRLVGIKARVLGADSVFLAENILASPLEAASAIKTVINHGAIGTVSQVTLTPVILVNENQEFCTESKTIVEDIRPC